MRFDILTLFPEMVRGPLSESVLGRAVEAGLIEVGVHDIRKWAPGKHKQADDCPFGGGDGMVMKADVLVPAIREVRAQAPASRVVLLTPQGELLSQELVQALAKSGEALILVCGHYAGIDERVREMEVDLEISIGDYVLSGGEIPALALVDAVARQLPGVLGNEASPAKDSFPARLEYPQYTRPAEFEGRGVPEVLLSGHHAKILRWEKKESLRRTLARRPDLFEKYPPDEEEAGLLEEIKKESGL